MTQVGSIEVAAKITGVQDVKNGFAEIAKAAKAAAKAEKDLAREKMLNTKTLLNYNKQVAREEARAAKQAVRDQKQNRRELVQGFRTAAIAAAAVGVAIK